jgi:hypothetical protein
LLHPRAPADQLQLLRERGYVRETEAVPLVQRYTERVALDALSEPGSLYRLSQDAPPLDVVLAASTRSPVQLLAEALRRGLDPEAMISAAGGLGAIPIRLRPAIDLDALDLGDRERRLLGAVDGESTVEALLLASGLRQEAALRVLAVARALKLIDVLPAPEESPRIQTEQEIRRLRAKFDEIQEADYFAMLGLARSAGRDEVDRAFQLLSSEFHPLRFAGHPDPALQRQASTVHQALEEAALVLRDDRLRAEYARNLVD